MSKFDRPSAERNAAEIEPTVAEQWERYRQKAVDNGTLDAGGRWIKADGLDREQRKYLLGLQKDKAAEASFVHETNEPVDEVELAIVNEANGVDTETDQLTAELVDGGYMNEGGKLLINVQDIYDAGVSEDELIKAMKRAPNKYGLTSKKDQQWRPGESQAA